jgi:hypothetical protein
VLYVSSDSPNIYDVNELSSPNNKQFAERIRDKYVQVELDYDNANNNLLKTNSITTIYRDSPR